MVATLHRIDRFLSVELSLTRLPPMAVVRSSSAVTAQNAAGKKEITTVLLPLVKLWKIYEYLRDMKKRWTLKTKGPALSWQYIIFVDQEGNQRFINGFD